MYLISVVLLYRSYIVKTLAKFCEVFNITCSELFAFDHIKPQEELKEEIIQDINSLKSREKIETLYKIVKAIKAE